MLCMGLMGTEASCRVYEEYLDGFYFNISALGVAAIKNDADAVDDLVKDGCDVNYNGTGIRWINMKYVSDTLDKDYTNEEYSYEDAYDEEDFSILYGETALHIAVNDGGKEVVKQIVKIPGVDIDAKSGRGDTALHDAAGYGLSDVIETLHSAGADLDSINNDGYAPLHSATMYGQAEGVKTLALLGADLDTVGGNETVTALTMAVQMGFTDVVEILVEMGANPDVKDATGKTARDWAAEWGDEATKVILGKSITNMVK